MSLRNSIVKTVKRDPKRYKEEKQVRMVSETWPRQKGFSVSSSKEPPIGVGDMKVV